MWSGLLPGRHYSASVWIIASSKIPASEPTNLVQHSMAQNPAIGPVQYHSHIDGMETAKLIVI